MIKGTFQVHLDSSGMKDRSGIVCKHYVQTLLEACWYFMAFDVI